MTLTQLGEGNELATIFASLVDPVDGAANRLLEVEPARLSVDGGGLVLLESRNHDGNIDALLWDRCVMASI
jgi:hypothetical protein